MSNPKYADGTSSKPTVFDTHKTWMVYYFNLPLHCKHENERCSQCGKSLEKKLEGERSG